MTEHIKLHYPPSFTELPQPDTLTLLSMGGPINVEMFEDEVADNRSLLKYAQSIGIELIAGPSGNQENDYIVTPETRMTTEEEHDLLRDTIPHINIPKTVTFDDYEADPFLPMVAKRSNSSLGQEKYLIEEREQWKKLRLLLNGEGPLFPRELAAWRGAKDPYQDRSPGCFTDMMDFQQYIDSPSDRYTSYRVLVGSKGDVIASSLLYSSLPKQEARLEHCPMPVNKIGNYVRFAPFGYLTHPDSHVYLNSRSIASNLGNGGSSIVLNPVSCSKARQPHENEILEAHGISRAYPELPEPIRHMSGSIGRTLGKRKGIITGVDWIQDQQGSHWYLETNAHPGPQAYADRFFWGMELQDITSHRRIVRAMSQSALRSLVGLSVAPYAEGRN